MWEVCAPEDCMAAEAMAIANPWEQIKARLTTKISTRAYEDWVTRTAFDCSEGRSLKVSVPDQVTKQWMEQEYAEDVRQTISELKLPVERVIYPARAPGDTAAATAPEFAVSACQLNQKFSF